MTQRVTRPIFIGGTSRSGSTVIGKGLLNRHSEIACTTPVELWFLTDAGGLCDLSDAEDQRGAVTKLLANSLRHRKRTPVEFFDWRMRNFWFKRLRKGKDTENGLFKLVSKSELADALAQFRTDYPGDRRSACREFAGRIIDPTALSVSKSRWVETTPRNAGRADSLHRLYPDMKLVYAIRDGRDVAASLLGKAWGPDDLKKSLNWWYKRSVANGRAIEKVPRSAVHVVQLEKLVGEDREAEYKQLLEFLEIADEPRMRRFFDNKMNLEAASSGRWRRELTARQQEKVSASYNLMIEKLDTAGIVRPLA